MTSVVAIKRPPSDLAERLRELADAADRGELTDMVACYVIGDDFAFLHGTGKLNAIAMAAMLQSNTLDAMRA